MSNESRSDDFVDSFIASAFASNESSLTGLDPALLFDEETPERIGRFRVVERIGAGGVGLVYRVEDPDLGRDIAVKLLRAGYAERAATVERFREEARVCGRLTHPGVVTIHEVGTIDDGRPFIAMKLVDGETLASLLTARAFGQGSHELLDVFEKVCQTVGYAHGRGVVHGDLKPHNVMVGAFGEVQVMDWGFAREADPDESATGAGVTDNRGGGTPAYMAPEQCQGSALAVSTRTDVFGLGAILCEILTGAPPYLGEGREEVYLRAREAWQDDMHARLDACGVDPQLVDLARRCLAPEPELRPGDAGEVARRIVGFQSELSERARAAEIEAAEAHATAVQERRARRLTLGLSLSIAAAILVSAGSLIWFQREASARALDAQRAVDAALATALAASVEAEAGGPDAEAQWQAVLAAVERARVLSTSRDADPRLAARVEEQVAALEVAADDGLRSLALKIELDDLRPHKGDDRVPSEQDRAFATAFSRIGVDLEGPIEQAVEIIRRSRIRDDLIASLDHWARYRRDRRLGGPQGWKRVAEIAKSADEDAWRNEIRRAYFDGDRAGLLRLADQVVAGESQSVDSIDLLGWCLIAVGQRDAGVRLYRHAVRLHPEDYDLSHNLAGALESVDPTPREEITRLNWACVAMRPDSAHAATDLGLALLSVDRPADALVFLDRAIELGSTHPRGQYVRGIALEKLGRTEEARDAFGIAARRGMSAAWLQYGRVLDRLHEREASIEALREAYARLPDDPVVAFQLGRVLSRARINDEAIRLLERALELDGQIAEAWCMLAHAYLWTGRFTEGVEAMRTGDRLGRALGDVWSYPSSAWVGFAEQLSAIDGRLEAIRAGEEQSTGPFEDSFLGTVAMRRGLHREAYDYFESALTVADAIRQDERSMVYFEAALTAMRVAETVEDGDRAGQLRVQALAWLEHAVAEADDGGSVFERWRYEPEVRALGAALGARPEGDELRARWIALDERAEARLEVLSPR